MPHAHDLHAVLGNRPPEEREEHADGAVACVDQAGITALALTRFCPMLTAPHTQDTAIAQLRASQPILSSKAEP